MTDVSGDDRVLFEVDRELRIATVTFNNPKQRNSYDATMRDAVGRCLDVVAADDDVTVVVLRGVEGVFSTGFKNFEAMLKAYPKTRFIGHADAFWANVSADYANDVAYPSGPVKRGGVSSTSGKESAAGSSCCATRPTPAALSLPRAISTRDRLVTRAKPATPGANSRNDWASGAT